MEFFFMMKNYIVIITFVLMNMLSGLFLNGAENNLQTNEEIQDTTVINENHPEFMKQRIKECLSNTHFYHLNYDEKSLNLQLKRLVNFVEKGTVRWDASLDEVVFRMNMLQPDDQFKLIMIGGFATGVREFLIMTRNALNRHRINFLWFDVYGASIYGRHRKIPLQASLSFSIQGEKGFSLFFKGRRLLYSAFQNPAAYNYQANYLYLLPCAGIYFANTRYPTHVWKSTGIFVFKSKLHFELIHQYLKQNPRQYYLYCRVLCNLPESVKRFDFRFMEKQTGTY